MHVDVRMCGSSTGVEPYAALIFVLVRFGGEKGIGQEMRTEEGDRGRRRGESHLRWKQARYLSGSTVQCLAREGALT